MKSRLNPWSISFLLLSLLVSAGSVRAELPAPLRWTAEVRAQYKITPDIVYLVANNFEAKLDVYVRRDSDAPQPTLINIHGGGWVAGTKEGAATALWPWLALGWNVVNVEYRLGKVSRAPAAVEDCLCALKWVAANADKYHFDLKQLVTSGDSAGGHLSLTTGMIPESAGLDLQCPGRLPKVAAIVDWYGITDVNNLLTGPDMKSYAVAWLGGQPDREAIAKRVSPQGYVRAGLPPTLMIHGDADPTVPYRQSVELHNLLDKAGVPNQILTVPGGKHGNFTAEQQVKVWEGIVAFLSKQHLGVH